MGGGAIYNFLNKSSSLTNNLTISGTTFDSNESTMAGAIGNFQNLTISDSVFTDNKATSTTTPEGSQGGGALFLGAESTTKISNTVFDSNTSALNGGAIAMRTYNQNNKDAKLDIENSSFTGNIAATNGGAIDNWFYNSQTTGDSIYIADTDFIANEAVYGGAIAGRNAELDAGSNAGAKLDINNSTFTENSAGKKGGAIYNTMYNSETVTDAVYVGNSTFEKNSSELGGAIYNEGKEADGTGHGAVMVVENGTFTDNTADKGGAIYNAGTLTLKGDNTFTTETDNVVNDGTLTVADGTTTLNATLTGTGSTTVSDNGVLEISADNLQLELTNNGTVNLGAGTLANAILGTGTTSITTDSTILNAENLQTTNIALGNNSILGFTTDATLNNVSVATGEIATFDIQGASNNIVLASLTGDANLKMDWKDTFNVTDSTNTGAVNLTSVDMTGAALENYVVTDLGKKFIVDINTEFKNLDENKIVTYSENTGKLSHETANSLQQFAKDTEASGETIVATYAMTDTETFDSNDPTITVTNNVELTVAGNTEESKPTRTNSNNIA
ncbi:hypothetical protein IJV79_02940 [bacterium]|nr:hypothetical protein [bacterium]